MQRLRFIAITALALLTAHPAVAQEPTTAASEHTLTPPKLVTATQPVYPPSKLASSEQASVALVLTLDATGAVTDVAVATSGGAEFDEAAVAAAREMRFEPALRDGVAVPAKIPFRVEFAAPPPATAPAETTTEPPVATVAPAPVKAAQVPPSDTLDIAVEGERPPREATMRSLAAEEISKIPGTNGDALRSLQNMPGVARVGAFDGLLVVRGSSPRDSQIFIDGTNVPIVYHFGGLSSVVPSEMLERIDFYPGNFGPQYGRATGGIVDVGVRSPKKDKLHGLLQVDSVDARLLVEGPLGDKTRFMLGGRRSWVDVWLGPVLRSAGVGVTTAPVYYDYQAMLEHDVTRDTTARLFFLGSDDRLRLSLDSPDARDPAAGGNAGLHTSFWRLQARLDTRPNDAVRWRTTASIGQDSQHIGVGNLNLEVDITTLEARSDVRAKLGQYATAIAGVDMQYSWFDVGYRLPVVNFEDDQANEAPVFGKPTVDIHGKGHVARPAGYAMLELTPLPGLKLLPGIRSDYDQGSRRWSADPRIGVRYDVHADYPRTTLKGGAGLFHQPPEPYESIKPFGNSGLKPERAYHYSLGFEQVLAPPLELSLEGFYKDLRDIVVTEANPQSANGRNYVNLGSGRTYGSELLLRYKPGNGGRFFGWVAYTLARSERRDTNQDAYYRYDYDQTHNLTAVGSYKLGRGWQLGARFRYVTGSPYTPQVGGTMDYDAGTYAPVTSLARNSARLPAFHQLDLRVDKTWKFQAWSLSWYLDVQNTYIHQNTEAISYNFDYSQTTATHGIPFLPITGLRGEL